MLFDGQKTLAAVKYLAHHDLSQTVYIKIQELLKSLHLDWPDIEGVICFKGPGSFTGLRIGLTLANSLAYGLDIPIVGSRGSNWQTKAIDTLLAGSNEKNVYPFYGAEPHVTQPKK